jgi:hypothetical protein
VRLRTGRIEYVGQCTAERRAGERALRDIMEADG